MSQTVRLSLHNIHQRANVNDSQLRMNFQNENDAKFKCHSERNDDNV